MNLRQSRHLLILILLATAVFALTACRQEQSPVQPETRATATPDVEPEALPAPTSTPQPSRFSQTETPAAAIDDTYDLEDFPPDQPLIVYFNQPMNLAHQRPLLISPNIPGAFSWDDAGQTLTFTPNDIFTPGRKYTVSVNASFFTRDGEKFDAIQRWQVNARTTPTVLRRDPRSSEVGVFQPQITLTFQREMDADSVVDSLSVAPALPFSAYVAENVATIVPEEPLQFGVTYTFTLAKTAVDQDGEAMAAPYTWDIQLMEPLAHATWPTATNLHNRVHLRFNYPIAPTNFADLVTIDPPIAGSWEQNAENHSAVFTADGRFDTDTIYTVTFNDDLQDLDGHTLPAPATFRFTTPTAILAATPASTGNPAFPVVVEFDRPMDEASVEAAFAIEPAVDGSFSWDGNLLTFEPDSGYLEPETEYTVTVAETAVSAAGETVLKGDYAWTFTTSRLESLANFGYGPNVQVLDVDGRRAIHFQAVHRTELPVTFDLYTFDQAEFLSRFVDGFDTTWWEEAIPDIPFDDLPLAASWQTETSTGLNDWGNIQETIVPDDVPPGLYLLNLTAGRLNDQLFVVVSSNTIMAKVGDDGLTVWVTDINDEGAANLPVQVVNGFGELLTEGQTNANGLFTTTLPELTTRSDSEHEPQLLILAGSDNDLTLTGLNGQWTSSGYWGRWNNQDRQRDYTMYTVTDRPVFRPGHTVYFKSIIRADDDAVLSVPPAGTAVTIQVRDARDNLVQTFNLRTNDFGTVDGEFTIADGAMLGHYNLEVIVNEDSSRQPFKVEEYRKPDYTVTVTADQPVYTEGTDIDLTIDAEYFFGEPVTHAEVTIQRYSLVENWDYSGESGDYIWYDVSTGPSLPRGETDENGRLTLSLASYNESIYDFDPYGGYSSDYGSSLRYVTLGLEATVNDGSNQTVSGAAIVRLYNAAEGIQMDHGSWVQNAARPFPVALSVATYDGQPVAGRDLTLTLNRYSQTSYQYDQEIVSETAVSDENGRATITIGDIQPGYYQLRAEGADANNKPMRYTSWVYVTGDDYPNWYGSGSAGIRIEAEAESYAPGETAVLLIETPVAGPALLTVERATVRRTQLISLTPPLTRVELPILASDVPNVHVTVNAWEPRDTSIGEQTYESIPDSRLLIASTNIAVPPTDKQLTVTITPDQETYAPGAEATFTFRVTNYQGVPVSAELSAALVDEAIFALSEELSGPIFDGFYFQRDNLVSTYHSLAPYRYMGGGFGGGGGGGPGIGALRSDFEDTAVWLPTLRTDFNGEATVTVTLPDNLTTWRMTAKAVTADTQVGEATATILTQQDVLVRPLLPRQLTSGDSLLLTTLVHNYTETAQGLAVSLQEIVADDGAPLLTIANPVTQTLLLEPGEVRAVGWSVSADRAGDTQLLVWAQFNDDPQTLNPGETADAVQLPLTVQPLAIPDVTTEIGEFTNALQTTVTMPADALEMSTVQIELSRSIAGSVLQGLEDLTGYPYGCVEQTMSAALPNAVVGRLFNQLGLDEAELSAEFPEQMRAGVQRLYGFQHDDGGWGWWYDDNSQDYQTAWVLFGLATAAEADYEIDPAVLERGANYLQDHLADMDPRTRAFALYSMALAGHGSEPATRALMADAAELDAFGQAALALTLHRLGLPNSAQAIMGLLVDTAIVTENGRVYWDGLTNDGAYNRKMMASSPRSTALALSAFSTILPGHELESGIVRWLMGQRRSFGWGTTNETAFAIIGLTDHLLATGFAEDDAEIAYTVIVNGTTIRNGTIPAGALTDTITLNRAELADGDNDLTITQSGGRQLYVSITTRALLPQPEIAADGVIRITRTYRDGETNDLLETFTPGQLVKVTVSVNMPQAGSYMLVEDQLPAGLEALNEGLNTTSHIAHVYNSPQLFWMSHGYNQKEIRDNRVTFFVTEMRPGNHTFSYFARVTQQGDFTIMPAEAYAMYDLSLWGRSGSLQMNSTP